jgi:GDPmannose 4,6-dehydratase
MTTAIVTGITGQDGSYMAELLNSKGYRIVGVVRKSKIASASLLPALFNRVELVEWDMLNLQGIADILFRYQPDKLYNFAAYSLGSAMFDSAVGIGDVNGLAVTRILEAIREVNTNIRFCQASSSEMFGDAVECPQTEKNTISATEPLWGCKTLCAFHDSNLSPALQDVRVLGNIV